MVGMVGDAEMSLDQHYYALGGPEFGAPAAGLAPLQEQLFKSLG